MAVGNKFAELQGLNYVPNDAYLQEGFTGSEPLDFSNISSSGIMTQAPIIYPPVNQGGGGGPIDPGPTDYGYNSIADNPNATPVDQPQTNFEYDIREGTIDDEDIKNNQTKLSKMDLVKAGLSTMFLGPFSGATSIYRSQKKAEQERIDKINAEIEAQYGPSDPGSRGRDDTPGFGKTAEGNYSNQFEGGDPGLMADGGRAGYFFGGRVNYKAGGRTDAGPNRTTASHSTRGQINESGQQVSGGQTTRDNNGGNDNNPPVSNYDYSKLVDQYKEEPDYTLGNIELNKNLTNNTRLNTILNLQKTVEDKELAGQLELDKRLGPVDTRLTYGTDQKPKLSASYMNYSPALGGIYANADSSDGLGVNYAYNNIGANADFDNSGKFERAGITYDNNGVALGLDTQDGVTASYSKDIFDGTGQIKAGGRYDPITGEYNAEGKISFPFANGGLAGLL